MSNDAPTDDELVQATKAMVALARKNGQLEHYTRGFVRESLERDFKLPAGSLKPRKRVVNTAIEEAMAEDTTAGESSPAKSTSSPSASAKPKSKNEEKKRKTKDATEAPPKAMASDTELSVLDDGSPVKKKKRVSKTTKMPTGEAKAKRANKNTDNFLSMIGLAPGSAGADAEAAALLLNGLTGGVPSESDGEPSVPKKSKSKKDTSKPKKSKKGSKAKEDMEASGSEMSVLEDKPVKKERTKKAEKPLDKDDVEIKRLKSFILACGVRKKWAKEFEGLSSASQQTARLRKILGELGMTGRLSMEKAKEIKARRDLAQEMEDVLEFDSKINGGGGRSSRSGASKKKKVDSDHEEDPAAEDADRDGEDSPGPSTGRKRPRNSILAFLDDQSDSD